MLKKDLRRKYKALRKELSAAALEEKSVDIANQSLTLPLWEYQNYHLFLPIIEHHEVNTEYLLQILFGKDKNVVVSRSNFEDRRMTHFLLTDNTVLKKNEWNIPEPVNGIPIADEMIDVVFLPLLAFDLQGNRVGYGKGFYDTFLSLCKKDVVKVGVSFFEAEPIITDASSFDVPLDYALTPHKTYTF